MRIIIGAVIAMLLLAGCGESKDEAINNYIQSLKSKDVDKMMGYTTKYSKIYFDISGKILNCKMNRVTKYNKEIIALIKKVRENPKFISEKEKFIKNKLPKLEKEEKIFLSEKVKENNNSNMSFEFKDVALKSKMKKTRKSMVDVKKVISDINNEFIYGGKNRDKIEDVVGVYLLILDNKKWVPFNEIDSISLELYLENLYVTLFADEVKYDKECVKSKLFPQVMKEISLVSQNKDTFILRIVFETGEIMNITYSIEKNNGKWKINPIDTKEII